MSFLLPSALTTTIKNTFISSDSDPGKASRSADLTEPTPQASSTTPSLSWFAIYREAAQESPDDVDILFCRIKETAITRERIGRQIGVMRGTAAFFASMVAASRSQRRWTTSVHSQKHRGLIIDIEEGITIVATLEAPRWPRSSAPKVKWQYDESWASDSGLASTFYDAWDLWTLLNGTIDSFADDRPRLERSLERFFFKWNPFATMGSDERQTEVPCKFTELDPAIGSLFQQAWNLGSPRTVIEVILCDDTNLHLLHSYRDPEARLSSHSAHLLSRHAIDLTEIAATHQSIAPATPAPDQAWTAKAGLFSLWLTSPQEEPIKEEGSERPSARIDIRRFSIIHPVIKETRTVHYWTDESIKAIVITEPNELQTSDIADGRALMSEHIIPWAKSIRCQRVDDGTLIRRVHQRAVQFSAKLASVASADDAGQSTPATAGVIALHNDVLETSKEVVEIMSRSNNAAIWLRSERREPNIWTHLSSPEPGLGLAEADSKLSQV